MNRSIWLLLYLMRRAAENVRQAASALFDRWFGLDFGPVQKSLDAGVERVEQELERLRLYQRSLAHRRDTVGLRARLSAYEATFRLIPILANLRETRDLYQLLSLLLRTPRRPWWRPSAGPFA